jgi:hypothetical protein
MNRLGHSTADTLNKNEYGYGLWIFIVDSNVTHTSDAPQAFEPPRRQGAQFFPNFFLASWRLGGSTAPQAARNIWMILDLAIEQALLKRNRPPTIAPAL